MKPLARVGDTIVGVCGCHGFPIYVAGIIINGASNVSSSGKANSRIGDMALAICGHTCIIASGSSKVFIENKPAAHITDVVVGCVQGVISSGDSKVLGN